MPLAAVLRVADRCATSGSPRVRENAAIALANLGPSDSAVRLTNLFVAEDDPNIRDTATAGIMSLGEAGRDIAAATAVEQLRQGSPTQRGRAYALLGDLVAAGARPAISGGVPLHERLMLVVGLRGRTERRAAHTWAKTGIAVAVSMIAGGFAGVLFSRIIHAMVWRTTHFDISGLAQSDLNESVRLATPLTILASMAARPTRAQLFRGIGVATQLLQLGLVFVVLTAFISMAWSDSEPLAGRVAALAILIVVSTRAGTIAAFDGRARLWERAILQWLGGIGFGLLTATCLVAPIAAQVVSTRQSLSLAEAASLFYEIMWVTTCSLAAAFAAIDVMRGTPRAIGAIERGRSRRRLIAVAPLGLLVVVFFVGAWSESRDEREGMPSNAAQPLLVTVNRLPVELSFHVDTQTRLAAQAGPVGNRDDVSLELIDADGKTARTPSIGAGHYRLRLSQARGFTEAPGRSVNLVLRSFFQLLAMHRRAPATGSVSAAVFVAAGMDSAEASKLALELATSRLPQRTAADSATLADVLVAVAGNGYIASMIGREHLRLLERAQEFAPARPAPPFWGRACWGQANQAALAVGREAPNPSEMSALEVSLPLPHCENAVRFLGFEYLGYRGIVEAYRGDRSHALADVRALLDSVTVHPGQLRAADVGDWRTILAQIESGRLREIVVPRDRSGR